MSDNEVSLTPGDELRISFDKASGDISIHTAKGNKIVFNDENKEIIIRDINNNSVRMSDEGITLSSPKNISINADQNVSIKGNTGVNIEASGGDVDIKGMNIHQTANMTYSATGDVIARVQGGDELSLKGAMVMIN